MKAKYEIVKLLDYLRAKTDPKFKNNEGLFYDPKISKKEKYDNLIEINLLKWIYLIMIMIKKLWIEIQNMNQMRI